MALLEREAELAAVERAVTLLCGTGIPAAPDNGAASRGGLLAFTGAAGLGKTALLRETAAHVTARGGTVLYASGGEQEQEVGFHVVRRLLAPLRPALDERELRAELGSWYDLAAPAAGLPAPGSTVVPHPHGVRLALDRLFGHLAVRHGPLAVLVDDAHWADPASLAWLTGFAPRAPGVGLLCALGYDPQELRPEAAPFRAAVDGAPEPPYGLTELSTDAVARLARDTTAEAADTAFAEECRKLTGGNPRAVTELLHQVRDAGLEPRYHSVPRLAGLAPPAPEAELQHRLQNLGPDCVRLCWAVAVLGADATLLFAARVAGLRGETARGAVARLRAARVLEVPDGGADGEPLSFVHPSVAAEIYRAVPASIRTALHGQTAAALAADPGIPYGSSVRHLLEVHPDGDLVLVEQLRRAAHEYTVAGAPDAAYRCLGRALREPPASRDRPTVLYELAAAAFRSGAPAAAVHPLRAALEEPACDAELRLAAVRLLARALSRAGRRREALGALEAEARRASAPAQREALRAELTLWRALNAGTDARTHADAPAHAVAQAEAGARAGARPCAGARAPATGATEDTEATHGADDTEGARSHPALRAWQALRRGESAATVLRHAEEAVAAGLSWTDDPWGCETPALVALTFLHCGRPDRAEQLLREGIAACERAGLHGEHLALARTLLAERVAPR
ncbi:ATP-binding protein [Streptomyces spirodelae]|uniref:AAA family ATPase n=1 Tax=Streptomyces spirodelae TaxID=2812904 RepID=A0ABS3WXI9_9ACTN|nr:AAA family ATPase [Streptomyces spirodelae]MBO8187844.1 AAA family ATPase [Streptomyces spirodelae]